MRFYTQAPAPENGQRIRRAFLFLPKGIKGEWRWMEDATWREVSQSYEVMVGDPVFECEYRPRQRWVAEEWVTP
ncbi:MAG: hypothetical protein ACK5PF_08890 [bacterium]